MQMTTLDERFASKVDASGGPDACWLWTGVRYPKGYGEFSIADSGYRAHRVAWVLANDRAIPKGQMVLHRCDVRLCVNPAHLFLGNHTDNMQDMVAKDRQPAQMRSQATCRKGHPRTPENTYVSPKGIRTCRPCYRVWKRAYRAGFWPG